MNFKEYTFSTGSHKNKKVIWIQFPYTIKLKQELRLRFPSVKWSQSKKSWYLPDFTKYNTCVYSTNC